MVKKPLRQCFNYQSFHIASMSCLGRVFSILLIAVLAVSSLLSIESAFAQTPTPSPVPIPKPSVPEYTIQLIGPEYVNPTTYYLDQNTGQIVADIGYTNKYSAVLVTIKNQPLVFDYSNVHLIGAFGFYYNIQIKQHSSSSNWINIYHADNGYGVPSNSEYTNLSFSIEGQMGVGDLAGTQIDIHVQAMIGEIGRQYNPNATNMLDMYPYTFQGETSDWSPTQTVSIPANVPLTSDSTPHPSSTLPNMGPTSPPVYVFADLAVDLALLAIAILVVIVVSLLLYVRHLKRGTGKPEN
jgi:hypothetical protein